MKALTLNLPDDVYRKLTCVAEENDISLPALLTHQVERFVQSYYAKEVDPEVHRHLKETIQEYRDVLEKLAQ